MPQSLANVIVHIAFSTKGRKPFLCDASYREEMHKQLGGASKTLGCPPIIVGGTEDHVHILARAVNASSTSVRVAAMMTQPRRG